MTVLTQNRRPLAATLAVLVTAAGFGTLTATPAEASGVYYRAELAQPVAETTTEVVRGVMWKCEGSKCIGTKGKSRAGTECTRFVSEMGAVVAFSYEKKAFDEAALAKCNAKAG